MMSTKLQGDKVSVNLVHDGEVNVNLYDGFSVMEELLVNYTDKGEQVMILDIGALVSLSGRP